MNKQTKRHLKGWIPDRPDHRDLAYGQIMKKSTRLPKSADLRSYASPVEDQGRLGSCTANALVGALELLEIKSGGRPATDLSRLFVYYNERVVEHTVESDSGAMLRDGIKTLAKQGVCPESSWPYAISNFAKKPSSTCYDDATKHRISTYHRISGLTEMRNCLADGYPFVFGFSVYESFESSEVAKTGTAQLPKPGESQLGGHAVLAVGYDDKAKRILVRNSWGTGWGQQGHFTLPYDYVCNPNLADDFWVVRSFEV
jgi:C1A family cysteine protease